MTPCAVRLPVPGSSHLYILKAEKKTPAVYLRKSDPRSASTNREDVVLEFRTRHVKGVGVTKSISERSNKRLQNWASHIYP